MLVLGVFVLLVAWLWVFVCDYDVCAFVGGGLGGMLCLAYCYLPSFICGFVIGVVWCLYFRLTLLDLLCNC